MYETSRFVPLNASSGVRLIVSVRSLPRMDLRACWPAAPPKMVEKSKPPKPSPPRMFVNMSAQLPPTLVE